MAALVWQSKAPGSRWEAPRGFWPFGDGLSDDSTLNLAQVYLFTGGNIGKKGQLWKRNVRPNTGDAAGE